MNQNDFTAYISSIQMAPNKPGGFQPIGKFNLLPSEQTSALIFADKESKRTISILGTGEFTLPPDKVKLTIIIKSVKDHIDEAKLSVHRRFEYVFQTMKKHRIKDNDISVTKSFTRVDSKYQVLTEIVAVLDDFHKYQHVQNLLVEKLDKTVTILEPVFYHTSLRLENIKQQASILAIRNAKHVAFNIAKQLGLGLGKPVLIDEKSCKEIVGTDSRTLNLNNVGSSSLESSKTLNDLINEKTISYICTIYVTFELKHLNSKHDLNNNAN